MANIGGGLQQLGRGIADLGGSLAKVEDGRNRDEARQTTEKFAIDVAEMRLQQQEEFNSLPLEEQTKQIGNFTSESNKRFDKLTAFYMEGLSAGARQYFEPSAGQKSVEHATSNMAFVSSMNGSIAKRSFQAMQDEAARGSFVNSSRPSYESSLLNTVTSIEGDGRIDGAAQEKLILWLYR
jgi:hypothetical protein